MTTLGEQRVRVNFNVTADGDIDLIKKHSAELINICDKLSVVDPSAEKYRLFELAKTNFETAAMWAVKAITTPKS